MRCMPATLTGCCWVMGICSKGTLGCPSAAHVCLPHMRCRRQDAASRERLAAVQRAQHLPAIKQAQAAARPASGAAALHKLACRPVFASSPGLAAAIEQAAAGIASLPGISTLQAGVDSGGAFSPGAAGGIAGLPGTQRPGWQDRKRTAAAAQVDAVYAQIQVGARGAGRAWCFERVSKRRGWRCESYVLCLFASLRSLGPQPCEPRFAPASAAVADPL